MKILIVSDIHANIIAFDAVLNDAPLTDALWNLGDTVGYGPCPSECLARLRGLEPAAALVGNHDLASIGALATTDFNAVAAAAAIWTQQQLSQDERDYLAALPAAIEMGTFSLAHGSPREPVWEYVLDIQTATASFEHFAGAVCFIGHSHVALTAALGPGTRTVTLRGFEPGQTVALEGQRWLVNPGSVGQPRDGDPRAAYAVLDTNQRTVTAHRVSYDIVATQRQMIEAGLPAPLIARLAAGR